MALPEQVRRVLPTDAARTWETVAALVPAAAYLGGGTAVAIHFGHRVSRDLDFFYHHDSIDLDELARELARRGRFAVTQRAPGTLNGLFSGTRLQFLHADEGRPQRLLEPPQMVAGVSVAGVSDLMAMKLKVIGDRGELRDYYDLMIIERETGRTAEEGLSLFLARYSPQSPDAAVAHIVRGLGYFGDVDEDKALPLPREEIMAYWVARQPAIASSAGQLS